MYETIKDNKICDDENFKPSSDNQELIIMIGRPASGKSTFTETYLVPKGYARVNRDTLKTMPKCLKVCKEELDKGNSVVIDNTNPTSDGRAEFISLAKERKIPVRCFIMNTPKNLNEHLNLFRERLVDVRRIPDIAFNQFNSKYEEPTLKEGFTEIHKINFVPTFKDDDSKELFFLRT
jgi:bifunctional polynucleotide phosphatase/kinase